MLEIKLGQTFRLIKFIKNRCLVLVVDHAKVRVLSPASLLTLQQDEFIKMRLQSIYQNALLMNGLASSGVITVRF